MMWNRCFCCRHLMFVCRQGYCTNCRISLQIRGYCTLPEPQILIIDNPIAFKKVREAHDRSVKTRQYMGSSILEEGKS